jgi:hypothetical protein
MACPDGRETAPEGREALIADLEIIGFDQYAPSPDWRDVLSDAQLHEALAIFEPEQDTEAA